MCFVRSMLMSSLVLGAEIFALSVDAQESRLANVLTSTPNRGNALLYADIPALRTLTTGSMLHADLPEAMGEVWVASELDLKTLEPVWEIGYVSMAKQFSPQSLAESVNGYVDTLAGTEIVWSPKQLYLVPLPSNLLGLVRPADRKLLGRWLRKERGNVSDFLMKQAGQNPQFISLMLAVDLEESISAIAIQQRIETFESLKGMDHAAITATLASIRGIRVIVGRKNLNECIISLDFASSPANLLPFAKDFFVEVLTRNQSSIPEASSWVPSVEGNSLSLRGTISVGTLDDLLGIFTLQRQASNIPVSSSPSIPIANSESAQREASLVYFSKMSDLIKRVRDYSADSTGDRAQWNGKMARRIDELPTLNVDPELVDFAVKASQGLRGNMVALQQTNISYGAAATVNGGNSGYYHDGNEPYKYNAMARAQGNSAYRQVIATIEQMQGDVRRKMTQKYQVQF